MPHQRAMRRTRVRQLAVEREKGERARISKGRRFLTFECDGEIQIRINPDCGRLDSLRGPPWNSPQCCSPRHTDRRERAQYKTQHRTQQPSPPLALTIPRLHGIAHGGLLATRPALPLGPLNNRFRRKLVRRPTASRPGACRRSSCRCPCERGHCGAACRSRPSRTCPRT